MRDGYHRAYGFLATGILWVPALVKEFETFEQVGLPSGLLPQNAYLGDRPPLLPHYLDDEFSADSSGQMTQKIVVIQAMELYSVG